MFELNEMMDEQNLTRHGDSLAPPTQPSRPEKKRLKRQHCSGGEVHNGYADDHDFELVGL